MFAAKVFAFLALALIVSGESDQQRGFVIMNCAKRAISGGVPELGIPTHDPFVVIKHDLDWEGDLGPVVHAKVKVHNMTWSGLATWELLAHQLSKDSDPVASFNFILYWEWMALNGTFDMEEKELIFNQKQHGTFQVDFNQSKWTGKISVTKPDENSNGTVQDLHIDWHVNDLQTKIEGLGAMNEPLEAAIGTGLITLLNHKLIGNTIGEFIKMRLTTIWWDTGKVWDLVRWCIENPE